MPVSKGFDDPRDQGGHSVTAAARKGLRALPDGSGRAAFDFARADVFAANLAPVAVDFAAGHNQQKRLPHRPQCAAPRAGKFAGPQLFKLFLHGSSINHLLEYAGRLQCVNR